MSNVYQERLVSKAEELGWRVDISESMEWEFHQYSPAGEDFGFMVTAEVEDLAWEVRQYAESFDTEEHIKMWIGAKDHGVSGVPCIRALVDDADDIEKMLLDLASGLAEVEDDDDEEKCNQMP